MKRYTLVLKNNLEGPAGCFEKFENFLWGKDLMTFGPKVFDRIMCNCMPMHRRHQCWELQGPPSVRAHQVRLCTLKAGLRRDPAVNSLHVVLTVKRKQEDRDSSGSLSHDKCLWWAVVLVRKYVTFLAEKKDLFNERMNEQTNKWLRTEDRFLAFPLLPDVLVKNQGW